MPPVCLGAQEYFRDVFDHLVRINAAIDGLREMLQTGISVTLTLVSIADSQVTKRLAAYGALITVPTLIAGIYGMNFEHMPELKWVGGYPLTLASMVADRRRAVLQVPQERLAVASQGRLPAGRVRRWRLGMWSPEHRIRVDRRALPPVLLRAEHEDREVQVRRGRIALPVLPT